MDSKKNWWDKDKDQCQTDCAYWDDDEDEAGSYPLTSEPTLKDLTRCCDSIRNLLDHLEGKMKIKFMNDSKDSAAMMKEFKELMISMDQVQLDFEGTIRMFCNE